LILIVVFAHSRSKPELSLPPTNHTTPHARLHRPTIQQSYHNLMRAVEQEYLYNNITDDHRQILVTK